MATPFSLEMCNLTKSMKQILEILHCFFFFAFNLYSFSQLVVEHTSLYEK